MQGRAAAGWPRRLALGAALGGLAATLLLSGFGFDGLPRPLPPLPLLAQAADASVPTGVTIPVDGRSLPAEPESEAMVAVGEESGNLDEMLRAISEHYDAEVAYAVKRLSDALGPVLIVGLAGVVGFFALSIFLPMAVGH